MHLDRKETVRSGHEHPARDACELVDELPLPFAAAVDVLDDRVREPDVELDVAERQGASVGANRPDCGERRAEPVELGVADRRDPLRPRIAGLEEVVGRAGAERSVGDADVDDGRLGPGLKQLEEEAQLLLAASQRRPRGEALHHRPEGTSRLGSTHARRG